MAIRWEFPLWVAEDAADTSKLKGKLNQQEQKWHRKDQESIEQIFKVLKNSSATVSKLRKKTGIGQDRLLRLLAGLVDDGCLRSEEVIVEGNMCDEYTLAIE